MRMVVLLLSSISAYCGDLIYLSRDASLQNLENLNAKYQQTLFVSDQGVYLIPSECQSERYFGGASEGILKLIQGPVRTEILLTTQEVFEAKDEKEIVKKIELEKTFAIAEGKVSKDFLEDKEGRGFGGASEIPLVIQNKIEVAAPVKEVMNTQPAVKVQRPTCQLLMDGSGYTIGAGANGQLYGSGKMMPIVNNTVLFQ